MKQYIIKLEDTYYTKKGFYGNENGEIPHDVVIYTNKRKAKSLISCLKKEYRKIAEILIKE